MIVLQALAVPALVATVAAVWFLVWVRTAPLIGRALLRKLLRELRRPPAPRGYASIELPRDRR